MKRGFNFNRYSIFLMFGIFSVFLIYFLNYSFTLTGYVITETVDNTGVYAGKYSSIAIDSNGKVHISHDADGDVSVDLKYCNNTAGSWSCADADSFLGGQYSSIAIDSNNKVHVSYYSGDLRYCNNTDGSWNCDNVDTGGDVGKYSSIAIDSNDTIHISHYNATGQDLRYCNNTAGSWNCTNVETTNNVGQYSSIAIDANDKIHISHYDATNTLPRYCNNTAGSWSCVAIEGGSDYGLYSSIAIDSNNKIHISYHNGLEIFLRYCNNTAGSWSCVDVGTSGGQYTSIAIDANDKIHISHYDATNDDLRYCNNVNGTWVCRKLADADANSLGTPNGRALALKKGRIVDSTSFSGSVHVSWYNNTDLMYTSYDPFDPTATATCSPSTISNGGTFPCTCSGSDTAGAVTTSGSSTGSLTDTSIAGTFTYTCTVTDSEGNTVTSTATYTVEEQIPSGGSSSAPLEGDPTLYKGHLLVQVNPGEEISITSFEGTGVKEVTIEVNQELRNVRIKVLKYDSKPAFVSVESSGKTYRYLEINAENLNENLNKATVKFEVEKSWVSDNGLNKNDLVVLKFDEQIETWNELETIFDSEDDNFYYYVVELDSFSFFAIGEKTREKIIEEKIVKDIKENKLKINLIWLWILIGIILMVVLIKYYINKKRRAEFNSSPKLSSQNL